MREIEIKEGKKDQQMKETDGKKKDVNKKDFATQRVSSYKRM